MNMQQSKSLINQVFQKAQEAASQENSAIHVMSALENISPEYKKILDGNPMWQQMKNKTTEEIEQSATNLLNDKNIVANVVESINPAYKGKIQNNILFKALGNQSPLDMGKFVMKTARLFGFVQSSQK